MHVGPFTIRDVVTTGICVGCGACGVASGSVTMRINAIGAHEADLDAVPPAEMAALDRVCPFSDLAEDETVLADRLFGGRGQSHDPRIGHHSSLVAGRVDDTAALLDSSSGGLTTWLLAEMFARGLIDGVIHVGGDVEDASARLFGYCVSTDAGQLSGRRKSQYYATEFSEALLSVRGDGKRYAIVGVPCFIKAARLLAEADPVMGSQLVCFVGLVCGHLKSPAFAELLAWQVGVPPAELERVDFRRKVEHRPANDYAFGALAKGSPEWRSKTSRDLFGGNWGHALFQLRACDFCDDIFAETADVCFGDAWIRRYEQDWRGTNIVVCRDARIGEILDQGRQARAITLEPLGIEDVVASQSGNFRHRWDGLSVRLADAARHGLRAPRKRIKPGSRRVSVLRRRIVRIRERMARHSHAAFAEAKARDDLGFFFEAMAPHVKGMQRAYRLARLTPRNVARAAARKGVRWLKATMPRLRPGWRKGQAAES